MNLNQTQLNEIIEKGSKISCERCNSQTFKMCSARTDDEGNHSSGKSEYFTYPVVVTSCTCCGDSSFEVGEKTIPPIIPYIEKMYGKIGEIYEELLNEQDIRTYKLIRETIDNFYDSLKKLEL